MAGKEIQSGKADKKKVRKRKNLPPVKIPLAFDDAVNGLLGVKPKPKDGKKSD